MIYFINDSYQFFLKNNPNEGIEHFERLINHARATNQPEKFVAASLWKARFMIMMGAYSKGIDLLESIHADGRKPMEKTLKYQAIFQNSSHYKGVYYFLKATAYFYLGRTDKSNKYALSSVRLLEKAHDNLPEDTFHYILSLHVLGKTLWRKRAIADAFGVFFKAVLINLKEGKQKRLFLLAKTFNLIGAVLMDINKVKLAHQYLKLSEDTYNTKENLLSKHHLYYGILYTDLAYCQLKLYVDGESTLEKYDTYYKKAYDTLSIFFGKYYHRYTAALHKTNARFLKEKNADYLEVINELDTEIEIRKNAFRVKGGKHRTIARAFNYKVRAYIREYHKTEDPIQKDHLLAEAQRNTQLALIQSVSDFENEHTATNPVLNKDSNTQFVSRTNLLKALFNKSELYLLSYYSSKSIATLNSAVNTISIAMDYIRVMLDKMIHQNSKLILIQQSRSIVELSIRLLHELLALSKDELSSLASLNPIRLYEKIQFGKAYLMLGELLGNRFSKPLPDSVAPRSQKSFFKLFKEIGEKLYEALLIESPHNDELLLKQIQVLKDLEEYLLKEKKGHEAIRKELGPLSPIDAPIEKLRASMDGEDIAIIEYFMDKENLYAVFLSKNVIDTELIIHKNKKKIHTLKEKIEELNLIINDDILKYKYVKDIPDPKEKFIYITRELYMKLIFPITRLKEISRLYIIPDSKLWRVPFEALLSVPTDINKDYFELPYLLHKYMISYHFSVPFIYTLHRTTPCPKLPEDQNFYFLNDAVTEVEEELNTLNFCKELVRLAGFNIPKPSLDTLRNEKDISDGFPNANVVLILLHGHPEIGIKLNETSRITINDIQMSSNVNWDLLILLNCFSGFGDILDGEGVVGLHTTFVSKGVKNIIYATDKLNFRGALMLIELSLRHLFSPEQDISVFEALHQAKKSVSKVRGFTPQDWSMLLYIGDQKRKIFLKEYD